MTLEEELEREGRRMRGLDGLIGVIEEVIIVVIVVEFLFSCGIGRVGGDVVR